MAKDLVLENYWYIITRSQDLQRGAVLKARLLGEDIILWRCNDQVLAWQDLCPHRGSSFESGWVEGDTLVCPYHGLAYDSSGQCVNVPANPDLPPPKKACVKTYQAQERYGVVWVCLGKPERDIISFPEWYSHDESYKRLIGGPFQYKSSPLRVVENFIDVTHLPFTHKGCLGDPSQSAMNDYEVVWELDSIFFGDIYVWQPDPSPAWHGATNRYRYRILNPLTVHQNSLILGKESAERRLDLLFNATPVDEEECNVWLLVVENYEMLADQAHNFMKLILGQDVAVVESQRPRRLPLDSHTEFHLPADRSSIAYRKWLKQLGITFGTTKE